MSWYEELDKWAADYLPEMEYEKDAPLDRYTSFRIGGPARRMAFPRSGEAAVLLVSHALELGARPFVLGNGTNVLFPDEGVERLVICTRDMAGVAAGAVAGEITAECGASLAKIAVFAQKAGLSGLEFAHGIPGSLGGAVCMNAGAYGGEMAQVVKEVTVLFPEDGVKTLSGEEMAFSYRHSLLTEHPDTVVLRAVPADVEPQNAESLLIEIANKLLKGGHDALNEHTEWVLHSISCRAAIKAGDKSSPQELLALAEKILSGEVPPFCPHGRPCVLKLTRKELEKQFGRIV